MSPSISYPEVIMRIQYLFHESYKVKLNHRIQKGKYQLDRVFIGKAPIDVIGAEEAAQWVLHRMHHGIRTRVAPVNSAIVIAALLAIRHYLFRLY